MKIAHISSAWIRTPPEKYGGVEVVASGLTEQLVALGHDVTLFATGDSVTQASLWSWYDRPTGSDGSFSPGSEFIQMIEAVKYISRSNFDIVHNHLFSFGCALVGLLPVPTVTTFHRKINTIADLIEYYNKSSVPFVSVSKYQQTLMPQLKWVGNVYNAIKVADFPFEEKKDDYLLFLGSIQEGKGTHLAIAAAKALGHRLIIAGPKHFPRYYAQIAPEIDGQMIEYVGEVNFAQKVELYKKARALLMPINMEESFGMVLIEALACGTPVIAFDRCAASEIVADKEVGFLVKDVDEMVGAIKKIEQISPNDCRKHVERYFDVSVMAQRYIEIYQQMIQSF
ncbi:MAG TPA: glycosyltransferase family 4 protein [Ktedonobacteraceae bacterium]|nr:glycosyltransferase family 4 protein [Ktedonobacteraceae bacterium]